MAFFHVYLILILISGSVMAEYSMNCKDIIENFGPCVNFVGGFGSEPSGECCNALKRLNKIGKQKTGPQRICQCIEGMAYVMHIRYVTSRIGALSQKCKMHLSFPISNSMDCSM